MKLIRTIKNKINQMVGIDQSLEKLLGNKDITAVLSYLDNNQQNVGQNITDHNVATHKIAKREDKLLKDKNGNHAGIQKVWKLALNYQGYINEIALVMLFGKPVKWIQESKNSDKAFAKYISVLKDIHFNSRIRQCKRLAGAESESALLLHWYKNEEGKSELIAKTLAKSLGDNLYYSKDQYNRLLSFARSYSLSIDNKVVEHCDIFTKKIIYRCKKASLGWEVNEEINPINKIPVILFQQKPEAADVIKLTQRQEWLISTNADTNDYFSSPAVEASASILETMPEKQDIGKVFWLKGPDDKVRYITWDSLPEGKKFEMDLLDKHILRGSFTPNIDFENLKGLGNVSGKALKQLMILAQIKGDINKEVYGEMLPRFANLITAIIANILDIRLKEECENLVISYEFQEPFSDDISTILDDLINAYQNNIISQESAVAQNPYVKNETEEIGRIKKEQEEKTERDRTVNMFESGY